MDLSKMTVPELKNRIAQIEQQKAQILAEIEAIRRLQKQLNTNTK